MISAIGVSYLLQNLALYITGGLPQVYPAIPWISDTISVFGASTKRVTLVTPVLTIILVVLLVSLIRYTKIGMAMRAVSKDFETSQLMGIKINSVISMTFVIGSFLAAVGSLLYFSSYQSVIPTSGAMPGLRAFVAAVFGGIGSIPGAGRGLRSLLESREHHQIQHGAFDFFGRVHVCAADCHSLRQADRPVRREVDRPRFKEGV